MTTRTIRKHELQKFLENNVALNFDSSWIASQHCALQRRSGYFAQGFSLFRLSIGPFRVDLFNKLLALTLQEECNITLTTVRERKTRLSTGSWISRFLMPREVWFEWDKRFDELDRMVTLIRSQLEPPYDQEITLHSMLKLIGNEPQKTENFPQVWARAVIRGLLGDMQFARREMVQLVESFGASVEKYHSMGQEAHRSIIEAQLRRQRSAKEMLEAMGNERMFRNYCDALTEKSAKKAGF